jgi:methylthioribose-1-phosphate isomerase
MTDTSIPPTVEWDAGLVKFLDQRRLPEEVCFFEARTVDDLCEAISSLVVRGAPALGVAGAMGIALAATTGEDRIQAAGKILATRPTAVNLRWGVERALAAHDPVAESKAIAAEDLLINRRIGEAGASLVPEHAKVLTHCNTGALACAGYGTAVGVIRTAHEQGRRPEVWVTETRPVMQGSRLTAWELERLGIPTTVITDSAAGSVMARGEVQCVIVGADRIAANGDVANKIGTYPLAVLAQHHGVPFYVAAPVSTVDLACRSGEAIPVEQRSEDEIVFVHGARVVPPGVGVYNPAFDVTPSALVSAIVTDRGVVSPPFFDGLGRVASLRETGRSL